MKNILKFLFEHFFYYFNLKIIRVNSHNNKIILIENIKNKTFYKISFFKNKLFENELDGYNWYSNKKKIKLGFSLSKNLFITIFKIKRLNGKKIFYNKSILSTHKYYLLFMKHYFEIWPYSKKKLPVHGDLTFDNLLFEKTTTNIIDWENFKKDDDVIGYDLVYLLLSSLILPNLNKKKINQLEKQKFLLLWKVTKNKIMSKKLRKNPIKYIEDKFKKENYWKNLGKIFPNKFFILKMSKNMKEDINNLF